VPDDVVMQKLASIDRCLRSVSGYVAGDLERLREPIVLDTLVRTVVEHRLGDFVDLCRELSAVS
jgi:hypothetical protein